MSEIERIIDQMDRAFAGDAWHGPNLTRVLEGVTAREAAERPIDGAHSIWELVNHIAAWNEIMRRELEGEAMEVSTEMDWPPVGDVSESAWKAALEKLRENRARIRKKVATLRDEELNEKPVARTENTRYVMLHGLVQHDLYHAGQIAILKKAFEKENAARSAGNS
jgi:uncharacterized damage-inducible protein DinB